MSRPPGPPPYTAEEIAYLDTPEKRFIAQAELSSYIMGHKIADLRDQGLLGTQPHYSLVNSHTVPIEPRRSSSPSTSNTPPSVDLREEDQSSSSGNVVGPRRGRPYNHNARRGIGGHRPYPPLQHKRPNYVDRSISWDETMGASRHVKSNTLCPDFTSTGKCARLGCFDLHDVSKLALCKLFLYKGACTKGGLCSLSHETNPNNTPHCSYFLENRCTNATCMFSHAHVDRHAPVCNSFGKVGYCAEGEACSDLHVYECPDFANNGICAAGEHCSLRHVHHASRMKAAVRGSGVGSPESFLATDDPEDMIDMSSPDENSYESHAITQQHDYVAFESQD